MDAAGKAAQGVPHKLVCACCARGKKDPLGLKKRPLRLTSEMIMRFAINSAGCMRRSLEQSIFEDHALERM